jgi:FAD/FMN-containing dehydrogenase
MLEAAVKIGLKNELEAIVGSDFVTTSKADLYIYSQDLTQAKQGWPDIVVLPKSVEEVQAVIRLANEKRFPLTPYVAGGNIGGLAIPLQGGVVLDLKRMDRIIEVNETDMYAVVEPGVTFGHVKAYLDKHHPDLVYTYAFSPPSTGIITNSLLQGLDNLSFRYGAASHWVSGMEVALATGELVRIGSSAVSKTWQAIVPFPELAGLFLGWQGTTGVITKMAVSLWPKPKHTATMHFQFMDMEGAYEFFRVMSRTRIPDDMIGTSFALGKVSRLAMEHQKASLYPALVRAPGEPEFTSSVEVSGNTEGELTAKVKVIEEVIKGDLKDINLKVPPPMPSNSARFHMQTLPVLSSGGGLTWVGCYGPMSRWLETAKKGCELQDKYNISRSCYTRIMNEGHFVGLRWMLPFDKGDQGMVKRIEALCLEQMDMILDMGYVPYKTPAWAIRKIEERAGPDWVRLHRRVKEMLDPNNIFNPGRWGAPEKVNRVRIAGRRRR